MQEKSPIKQRILYYLDYKNVSKYEFYKKSGVTRGVLDQNTGISEDSITKFIVYAQDISLIWLMTGEGDMLKQEEAPSPQVVETIIVHKSDPKDLEIMQLQRSQIKLLEEKIKQLESEGLGFAHTAGVPYVGKAPYKP